MVTGGGNECEDLEVSSDVPDHTVKREDSGVAVYALSNISNKAAVFAESLDSNDASE